MGFKDACVTCGGVVSSPNRSGQCKECRTSVCAAEDCTTKVYLRGEPKAYCQKHGRVRKPKNVDASMVSGS